MKLLFVRAAWIAAVLMIILTMDKMNIFHPPPVEEYASSDQPDQIFGADIAKAEPAPAVLIGAGDISVCGQDGDARTAALIERLIKQFPQAAVFTAGDNVQSMGGMYEYTDCFDKTWGKFKERIHPSPGNHDWYSAQGSQYFTYFGAAAGENGEGYYSYDLGGWHIVSLNSNCENTDCGEGSPQVQWLRGDLERNSSVCTLAYWHHPARSSGTVPIIPAAETFWRIASDFGVDVVVNGHDHHYERFAPLDRDGQVDLETGTRSFIVGTGGAWLVDLAAPLPATEAVDNGNLGVIIFLLFPDHYEWQFTSVREGAYTDSGTGTCSGR
jgi:hypothetical protein